MAEDSMAHPMFVKHQDLLGSAVHAIESRGYWSPYAENPRAYGENAVEEGRRAFDAYPDAQFYLDQPGVVGRGGGEVSPYGLPLNVSYPKCSPDALIAAGKAAMPAWIKAGPDVRAGVCAEILARLNAHSMEMAHAVMNTTGQPFTMAYQAGGRMRGSRPGGRRLRLARDEACALPLRMGEAAGQQSAAEDGEALHRGAARRGAGDRLFDLPDLEQLSGYFRQPRHRQRRHRQAASGGDPAACHHGRPGAHHAQGGRPSQPASLLADTAAAPVAKDVALKSEIASSTTPATGLGHWLEDNARQASVFAEKAGVNCIVIDSTDNYIGMLKNLVFTLSLYSGQMCTTPQTLFVAGDGVRTPSGTVPLDQFCRDLATAIGQFVEDPARAVEVLGAIQSPATLARLEAAADLGEVIRASGAIAHPQWSAATVRTPLLLKSSANDAEAWGEERFGPISFVVETLSAAESLAVAERVIREKGA
jgi:hypothetical protein